MDSYTITIAPNDDSGAATRLVVETSGDQVRITDVHLHAPQGLSSGHIPNVNFDLLLQAVTGSITAPTNPRDAAATALAASQDMSAPALEAGTATVPTKRPTEPTTSTGRARRTAPRTAAAPKPRSTRATGASRDETTAPQRAARTAASPKKRTGEQMPVKVTGKAATEKTSPASANKQTSKPAASPAKRPTPAKRSAKAAAAEAAATGGRVYRRTPDDLAAVFEQTGTVAGIAEHYQVPRYTAQGWVGRLRATKRPPFAELGLETPAFNCCFADRGWAHRGYAGSTAKGSTPVAWSDVLEGAEPSLRAVVAHPGHPIVFAARVLDAVESLVEQVQNVLVLKQTSTSISQSQSSSCSGSRSSTGPHPSATAASAVRSITCRAISSPGHVGNGRRPASRSSTRSSKARADCRLQTASWRQVIRG